MICGFCGHQNQAGAKFCSSCGRTLLLSEQETTGSIGPVEVAGSFDSVEANLPKGVGIFLIRGGVDSGSWYALDRSVSRIGRHPESDIVLDDITMSRMHAEVSRIGTRYFLTDVGSLNGTYHNQNRTDESELASGDEIQIGKYRFIFLLIPGEED